MTLSHDLGVATGGAPDHRNERVARGVGVALGKCLLQALESGRLKCGILASARLLQRCPERVLLCLLPVSPNNVCDHTLHIHHTLITAFCTEHGIRFLKVNGDDLLREVTRLQDPPAQWLDSDSVPYKKSSSSSSSSTNTTTSNRNNAAPTAATTTFTDSSPTTSSPSLSSNITTTFCSSSSLFTTTQQKMDVSCVLVKSPKDGLSFEDEVVLDYYDDLVNSSVYPKPVLSIPR